ncbi:type II toxin-antitoxin system HicB family antitoxin [Hoeflea sp.]|uniref:type II toxin-antitoxin system HicB family antitoxin n=1 Tax=Hoeflea sp. TaxID=1940281 RepID=UPI003B018C4D
MRIEHVALIHRLEDRRFRVSFPDVPQCIGTGGTPRRAVRSGRAALRKHIDSCVRRGSQLPVRSCFGPDIGDAFAMVFIAVECRERGGPTDGDPRTR